MRSMNRLFRLGLVGCLLGLAVSSARADQVWTVSLDTSRLAADYGGPFALDFELVGSTGNTITLSDFSFGGGTAGPGVPVLTGGASGDLGSRVSLNDGADFFSDFNQQFTPGGTLTFTVDSTLVAPPVGGTPDNFSMVILSGYDPGDGYDPFTGAGGTPIPTTDPTGNDTFVSLDVNGPGSTTAIGYPGANGDQPITLTPATVPEPPDGLMMLLGSLGLARAYHRRRIGAAHESAPGRTRVRSRVG